MIAGGKAMEQSEGASPPEKSPYDALSPAKGDTRSTGVIMETIIPSSQGLHPRRPRDILTTYFTGPTGEKTP